MSRRTLTDEQWERIAGYLPSREGTRGRSGVDNRLFVDAILWMAGNAVRWRDLPEVFCKRTGVHAAVDAIGLPIRIHPIPGQWGDRPQAEVLLAGLKGIGHVMADAACDADQLRAFIADDPGATAQINANPSRTTKPPIDWRLYEERHQVECFFNTLKRFRRIALRCEKTIDAFMGFMHLAGAMIRLRQIQTSPGADLPLFG